MYRGISFYANALADIDKLSSAFIESMTCDDTSREILCGIVYS